MSIALLVLWIVFAYFCGSIPSGYLLVKIFLRQDVRKKGSGNIGATNVLRTGGGKLAFATYVLDIIKVLFPMIMLSFFASPQNDIPADTQMALLLIVGGFGVIGHMYSIWLKFDGGKGVASFSGYLLLLSPYSAVFGIIVFAVLTFSSRIVSVAALCGVLVAAVHAFIYHFQFSDGGIENLELAAKVQFIFIVLLIFWRHNGNIRRLMKGEEQKIKL